MSCAARKATLVVPTRKATGAKLGRFPRFRPNFTQNFSKWRWWGVGRIFGRFWGAVIGTPVFFCFNHSSCNAARPLCMRCACAVHALRMRSGHAGGMLVEVGENRNHLFPGQLPCRSNSLFGWDTSRVYSMDRLSNLYCNYKSNGTLHVVPYSSLLHRSNHDLYFLSGSV